MSNVEKDNLFEEVVNEKTTSEQDDTCSIPKGEEQKTTGYDYWGEVRKQTNREYRKVRIRGFFRALVEIGGYVALGGVMLAAQLLDIVPAYVAVPVYQVSWIWSSIRLDRFFRR